MTVALAPLVLAVAACLSFGVRKRLAIYHAQTEPLVDYYKCWEASGDPRAPRYRRVDGMGSVEAIRDAALAALAR